MQSCSLPVLARLCGPFRGLALFAAVLPAVFAPGAIHASVIWDGDGVPQKLTNGATRMPCALAHANSTSYFKWGVYRSGSQGPIGTSYAYLDHPRLGTTYEDVAPRSPARTAPPA